MDKPITIEREEFVERMITVINESGLPFFVVADVLRNALNETDKLAQQQLRNDRQQWENNQKRQEQKNE